MFPFSNFIIPGPSAFMSFTFPSKVFPFEYFFTQFIPMKCSPTSEKIPSTTVPSAVDSNLPI